MRVPRYLALVAMLALALVAAPAAAGVKGAGRIAADPVAHDPTIVKQGRYYYSVGTGSYLPTSRSTDLLHWAPIAPVFAEPPAWIARELGRTPADLWAPDLSFFDGEYHLYYSASSFGRNDSVIGLATARTLDPDSAAYGWVDRGLVVRSRSTDTFNAIDPDAVLDADGRPWLSFGSFWDGVKLRRLDRATGLPAGDDPTLYPLASRGGASIEGPSILRRGGYYYLFTSLDYCCRGINSDYRVVVGRSTAITGPYVDRDGVALLTGGGTELLRGYNEFRGPGGGDVFGDWYVHHYYDAADEGRPKQSVRRIAWSGGWPSLGDPLSGSSRVGRGDAYFTVVNRANGAVIDNPTCGYEGADLRIGGPSASPCQQWRMDDSGDGYAAILNRHSNKVAEVAACINTDGARVAQWGWLANDCQKFRLVPTDGGWSRIENKLAGRVLEAAGCGGVGAPVQMYAWLGNACQQFRLDPVGDLLLADTSGRRVLDVAGCGNAHAGRLVVGRGSGCRLWRFTHTVEGYYQVINQRYGRPVTVVTASGGAPRLALGAVGEATAASQWRIEALNDGGYRLVNRDGLAADLADPAGAGAPGASDTQRLLLVLPRAVRPGGWAGPP